MTRHTQTPSQTVGPFFSIGLSRQPRPTSAGAATHGETVRVEGSMFDGIGTPVDDGLVEIWQAGRFARSATDAQGRFAFEIPRPDAVPTCDGGWQAPHLNVIVFARGMLVHAFTRVYFADDSRTATDPLLATIDPARRPTLLASPRDSAGGNVYTWDIHLQGEQETVFFDA
jgi:protocatechuate 3,4-dioxygenase alpha subunit